MRGCRSLENYAFPATNEAMVLLRNFIETAQKYAPVIAEGQSFGEIAGQRIDRAIQESVGADGAGAARGVDVLVLMMGFGVVLRDVGSEMTPRELLLFVGGLWWL